MNNATTDSATTNANANANANAIPSYAWGVVECGVATFVSCVFGSEGVDPGDCTLDLESAEDSTGTTWYRWTESESGDTGPARRTAEEAREDAEAYALESDESLPGEDASDMSRRLLAEAAGEPDHTGEWCVYWETVGDDSGVLERYATEDAAHAACDLANADLVTANPGGRLMCGYAVRCLVDGQWEPVEEDR